MYPGVRPRRAGGRGRHRVCGRAVIAALLFATAAAAAAPTPPGAAGDAVGVADLPTRLAKYRRVHMPFDASGLDARTRNMIGKLVAACQYLDEIYWEQADPDGGRLYKRMRASAAPDSQALSRYLRINGSRYDLIANDQPFVVGAPPAPPGRNLYPVDLTRSALDQYLAQNPEDKPRLLDPLTVVRRDGRQRLIAVPYHEAYRQWLEPMAQLLREAADLSSDAAFGKFLRLRAAALLNDDYFSSDLAWLDLEDPAVDLILAPYETYLDGLLGVKGSYGAAVLLRDKVESEKLHLYQQYVPAIQDALPLAAQDRPSKAGLRTPMEVMDAPFRAGDLLHGYQAVADNLPNDPRIHEQRGSKKIFFKNFMDARVKYVVLPISAQLLSTEQGALVTADGYLATVVMHEIAHGLGPAFARVNGTKQDIRAAIGASFAGLEEAKADIVGLYGLAWLSEHGALAKGELERDYVSHLAGILRTVRFGVAEAHGRAEMMEFNYFLDRTVILPNTRNGRYSIEVARMPQAVADLARELLEQEATGDRVRTEKWFARYGTMPPELAASLRTLRDVPVDVDPEWDFPESVPTAH